MGMMPIQAVAKAEVVSDDDDVPRNGLCGWKRRRQPKRVRRSVATVRPAAMEPLIVDLTNQDLPDGEVFELQPVDPRTGIPVIPLPGQAIEIRTNDDLEVLDDRREETAVAPVATMEEVAGPVYDYPPYYPPYPPYYPYPPQEVFSPVMYYFQSYE
eukprot:GHVU01111304.1.p1 GENE.GHVU01111304.1~~GHVU01111304.1.p1  ORF type:complete len:181 (-),score=28.97 GHVU01111304.1:261-728(-)